MSRRGAAAGRGAPSPAGTRARNRAPQDVQTTVPDESAVAEKTFWQRGHFMGGFHPFDPALRPGGTRAAPRGKYSWQMSYCYDDGAGQAGPAGPRAPALPSRLAAAAGAGAGRLAAGGG